MHVRSDLSRRVLLLLPLAIVLASPLSAVQRQNRKISGTVVTAQNEVVKGVSIIIRGSEPERRVVTNQSGQFDLEIPDEDVTLRVYYETQNFFESRVSPTGSAVERIHGTPGYPFGLTVGLTFHLGGK